MTDKKQRPDRFTIRFNKDEEELKKFFWKQVECYGSISEFIKSLLKMYRSGDMSRRKESGEMVVVEEKIKEMFSNLMGG